MEEQKAVNPLVPMQNGAVTHFRIPHLWWEEADESELMTTYDLHNKEQRRKMLVAFGSNCHVGKDRVNTIIDAVHVVAHPYQSVDRENGEVDERVRIVIVEEDGNCVQFSSRTIAQWLSRLSKHVRPLPWIPPMKLKLTMAASKQGQIYELFPTEE